MERFQLLEDQTGELEKLRLEKEKIEKQIAEKESLQLEFKRQEELRKQKLLIEPDWRNEFLKLRAEVELYRNETAHLLNLVRNELKLKIEEENLLTRATVESAVRGQPEAKAHTARNYNQPKISGTSLARNMVVILVFLFVIGVGGPGVYFYFNKANERKHEMLLPLLQQSNYTTHQNTNDSPNEVPGETSEVRPSATLAKASAKPSGVAKEQFDLTVTRALDDLIGQKLSGCDIVVRSVSEINNITLPVFVEKLPSGWLKYKFDVTITRNNETYTSSPYIYYTSDGRFVSIDGANCK